MALMPSCRAIEPTVTDPYGGAPADFSVDVTILVPQPPPWVQASPSPAVVEAHLRPSRYVLFADGSLHSAPDPQGRGVTWLPPLTRTLRRPQVAEVWLLAEQLGLSDPQSADPTANLKLVQPRPGEIAYVVDFSGFGRRWNFIRTGPANQPPDPALAQFIRRLAELAWADDLPESRIQTMPRRYDFGPDPYERYRQR